MYGFCGKTLRDPIDSEIAHCPIDDLYHPTAKKNTFCINTNPKRENNNFSHSSFSLIVRSYSQISYESTNNVVTFVKNDRRSSRERNYIRIEFYEKFSNFRAQFESNLDCNHDCIN